MTGLIQRFALQQFSTSALVLNIAKGTTGPGVDCFNQKFWFGLVDLHILHILHILHSKHSQHSLHSVQLDPIFE